MLHSVILQYALRIALLLALSIGVVVYSLEEMFAEYHLHCFQCFVFVSWFAGKFPRDAQCWREFRIQSRKSANYCFFGCIFQTIAAFYSRNPVNTLVCLRSCRSPVPHDANRWRVDEDESDVMKE